MWFLPSCGCINTIVWMHHLYANKMKGEKVGWELYKNATCFEQILKATVYKTATVRPLTSHLTIHLSKDEFIINFLL